MTKTSSVTETMVDRAVRAYQSSPHSSHQFNLPGVLRAAIDAALEPQAQAHEVIRGLLEQIIWVPQGPGREGLWRFRESPEAPFLTELQVTALRNLVGKGPDNCLHENAAWEPVQIEYNANETQVWQEGKCVSCKKFLMRTFEPEGPREAG